MRGMAHTLAHIRPQVDTSSLRWIARITCLGTAICLYLSERTEGAELPILLFFLVPALIAWQAHLLGGILLLLASAMRFVSIASADHALILPLLVAYLGGGVLHLAVWSKERIPSRDGSARLSQGLLWAAQLIPLTIALLFAWGAGVESIRDFDPDAFVVLTPPIVAVIALRWHLIGGIAIVTLSLVALRFSFREGDFGALYALLLLIPFFVGGMLHIVVWYSQRRIKILHKRA